MAESPPLPGDGGRGVLCSAALSEPDPQDPSAPRRRLVHHEPLRRWSPLTREEGREAHRFVDRLTAFPLLTASVVALLVWFYGVQLLFGWPFFSLLPTGGELQTELLMEALGDRLGWLDGTRVADGEWWRVVSATLLHGSLLHLAGNAFILYFLGRIVENLHGRAYWIAAYVGGGVAGACLSMALKGGQSIGASGAILGLVGVLAAFGLRWPDHIPKAFRDYFRLDMWFFVGAVGLMSLLPAVDWAGHLGGFLWGFALGLVVPPARLVSGRALVPRALGAVFGALFLAGLSVMGLRVWQTSRTTPASEIRALIRAVDEGDTTQALALSGRLMRDLPEADGMRLLRVWVLLEADRSEEALHLFDDYRADDPRLLELKWIAAFSADRPDLAVEALRRYEEELPSAFARDGQGNNSLAWALFLAHPEDPALVDEGMRRVREALRKRSSDRAFRNTLAYGLVLDGQPRRALKVTEDLLAGRSRDEQVDDVFIQVMALAELGQEDAARDLYRDFAAEFPDGTLREEAAERLRRKGIEVE